MKKAEFETIEQAVAHARQHGGWIFVGDNGVVMWYNASHYTPFAILKDTDGSGSLKPWRLFETEVLEDAKTV
jgi:hypothetical protein